MLAPRLSDAAAFRILAHELGVPELDFSEVKDNIFELTHHFLTIKELADDERLPDYLGEGWMRPPGGCVVLLLQLYRAFRAIELEAEDLDREHVRDRMKAERGGAQVLPTTPVV